MEKDPLVEKSVVTSKENSQDPLWAYKYWWENQREDDLRRMEHEENEDRFKRGM